jgi:hypothetical protein
MYGSIAGPGARATKVSSSFPSALDEAAAPHPRRLETRRAWTRAGAASVDPGAGRSLAAAPRGGDGGAELLPYGKLSLYRGDNELLRHFVHLLAE